MWGLRTDICLWKGGDCELKISKFGGLWAKIWVKIEAVEAKISKFSQKGVLWTRGATGMARGGIRLVHGHTKSTLSTDFSGMKIDPNYAFLKAFFLICPSCPFQNMYIWPKTHPFFQFCTFLPPKRYTYIQCLVLKNNPNYVNFWTSLIPPWHSSAPPPGLWTDSFAWNGTLANYRRGVKRGLQGRTSPYPLSRSVPPPGWEHGI